MPLGELSMICFEFLGEFGRKSQNEQGEKLGKNWAFTAAKGTFAAAKAASPRLGQGPKSPPSGSL